MLIQSRPQPHKKSGNGQRDQHDNYHQCNALRHILLLLMVVVIRSVLPAHRHEARQSIFQRRRHGYYTAPSHALFLTAEDDRDRQELFNGYANRSAPIALLCEYGSGSTLCSTICRMPTTSFHPCGPPGLAEMRKAPRRTMTEALSSLPSPRTSGEKTRAEHIRRSDRSAQVMKSERSRDEQGALSGSLRLWPDRIAPNMGTSTHLNTQRPQLVLLLIKASLAERVQAENANRCASISTTRRGSIAIRMRT